MDGGYPFYRQAVLIVRVLPYVARREEFALKGGTAINLFLRDLPRLPRGVKLWCKSWMRTSSKSGRNLIRRHGC